MEELGDLLRQKRMELGLTLDDIQQSTKIRRRYLEAIENGNLSDLPAAVYARGFIRSYAEQLGLDGQELIERYNVGAKLAADSPSVMPVYEPLYTKKERPVSRRALERKAGNRQLVWGIGILAVVVLGYAVMSWWIRHPRDGESGTVKPPANAAKVTPVPPSPQPSSHPPVASQPKIVVANQTPGSETIWVSGVPSLSLAVKATDSPCWISVVLDGRDAGSETLQPGDSRTYTASREIRLRAGHSPSLTGAINGQPFPFAPVSQGFNYDFKRTE